MNLRLSSFTGTTSTKNWPSVSWGLGSETTIWVADSVLAERSHKVGSRMRVYTDSPGADIVSKQEVERVEEFLGQVAVSEDRWNSGVRGEPAS